MLRHPTNAVFVRFHEIEQALTLPCIISADNTNVLCLDPSQNKNREPTLALVLCNAMEQAYRITMEGDFDMSEKILWCVVVVSHGHFENKEAWANFVCQLQCQFVISCNDLFPYEPSNMSTCIFDGTRCDVPVRLMLSDHEIPDCVIELSSLINAYVQYKVFLYSIEPSVYVCVSALFQSDRYPWYEVIHAFWGENNALLLDIRSILNYAPHDVQMICNESEYGAVTHYATHYLKYCLFIEQVGCESWRLNNFGMHAKRVLVQLSEYKVSRGLSAIVLPPCECLTTQEITNRRIRCRALQKRDYVNLTTSDSLSTGDSPSTSTSSLANSTDVDVLADVFAFMIGNE